MTIWSGDHRYSDAAAACGRSHERAATHRHTLTGLHGAHGWVCVCVRLIYTGGAGGSAALPPASRREDGVRITLVCTLIHTLDHVCVCVRARACVCIVEDGRFDQIITYYTYTYIHIWSEVNTHTHTKTDRVSDIMAVLRGRHVPCKSHSHSGPPFRAAYREPSQRPTLSMEKGS